MKAMISVFVCAVLLMADGITFGQIARPKEPQKKFTPKDVQRLFLDIEKSTIRLKKKFKENREARNVLNVVNRNITDLRLRLETTMDDTGRQAVFADEESQNYFLSISNMKKALGLLEKQNDVQKALPVLKAVSRDLSIKVAQQGTRDEKGDATGGFLSREAMRIEVEILTVANGIDKPGYDVKYQTEFAQFCKERPDEMPRPTPVKGRLPPGSYFFFAEKGGSKGQRGPSDIGGDGRETFQVTVTVSE